MTDKIKTLKMQTTQIVAEVKACLTNAFAPTLVEVIDQSHKHRNHAQAKIHGGAHLEVLIQSEKFLGLNQVARHRLMYAALNVFFKKGALHALSVKAYATTEKIEKPKNIKTMIQQSKAKRA